jgi:hypothetical protein
VTEKAFHAESDRSKGAERSSALTRDGRLEPEPELAPAGGIGGSAGAARAVLQLQRQAGNQAVGRLLGSGQTLNRQPDNAANPGATAKGPVEMGGASASSPMAAVPGTAVGPGRPRIDRHVEAMMDEDVEEVRQALSRSWVGDDDEAKALRRVEKWVSYDDRYQASTGYQGSDHLDKFLAKLKMRTFTVSTVRTAWLDEWTNAYDLLWYELEDERKARFKELVARSRRQATSGPTLERLENVASFMGKREAAGAFGIVKAGGTMLGGMADMALSLGGVEGPKGGVAGYLGKQFDETAAILFEKEVLEEKLDFGAFKLSAYEFGATAGKVPYGLALGAGLGKAGMFGKMVAAGQTVYSAEQLGQQLATLKAAGKTWGEIAQEPAVWAQVVGVVAGAVGVRGGLSSSQAVQATCQQLGIGLNGAQAALLVAAYHAVDADTTIPHDEKDRRKAELLADAASGLLSAADARYGERFKNAWAERAAAGAPEVGGPTEAVAAAKPATSGEGAAPPPGSTEAAAPEVVPAQPSGPPAPPSSETSGGDGGPRHRGATAEGTGSEFTYEYHRSTAEPAVETRRPQEAVPAPEQAAPAKELPPSSQEGTPETGRRAWVHPEESEKGHFHPLPDDVPVEHGRGSGRGEGEILTTYADEMRSEARRNPATAAVRGETGPYIRDNLYSGKAMTRAVARLQEHGILEVQADDAIRIIDPERYVQWLERAYRQHGQAHLDPRMREAIRGYVGRGESLGAFGTDPQTGARSFGGALPGTHAELLAINDLLAGGGAAAAVHVATVRAKTGAHFAACVHCAGIIDQLPPSVRATVWTGRATPVP